MKIEDVKVGDMVKCIDNTGVPDLVVGKDYLVVDVPNIHIIVENGEHQDDCFLCYRFEPVEQHFPLANTKINVQKYADKNGITLKQAHEEIQPWLFEQGYSWSYTRDKEVHTDCGRFLYCYDCSGVTHDNSAEYFVKHENKEITFSRKVS